MTRTSKCKPYSITFSKCPVWIHWWVAYATLLLCWSAASFITLLSWTQQFYIAPLNQFLTLCWGKNPSHYTAKQFPISKHCWALLKPNTLFRCTQLYYIADVNPNLLYCWALPNTNTMLRYSHQKYIAELYPILVQCRNMVDLNILLSVFAKRSRQPIRIKHYVAQ